MCKQICWRCSVGVMILIIPPLGKLFSPFVSHRSLLPLPLVCARKCNYSPCQPSRQYGGVRLHTVTGQGVQSDNLASRRIWFYVELKKIKKHHCNFTAPPPPHKKRDTVLVKRHTSQRMCCRFSRSFMINTVSAPQGSWMTRRWHLLQLDPLSLSPAISHQPSASFRSCARWSANRGKWRLGQMRRILPLD